MLRRLIKKPRAVARGSLKTLIVSETAPKKLQGDSRAAMSCQ